MLVVLSDELPELSEEEEVDALLSDDGGEPTGPPLAKVFLKTSFNSVAWLLVSLPLDTSPAIRSAILALMSPGADWVPELALELPLWSDESISVNADDSAVASVELILPDVTSDWSSF